MFRAAVVVLLATSPALAQRAERTDRAGVYRLVPSARLAPGVRLPKGETLVAGIVKGTNEFRQDEGREPLEIETKLSRAAQAFAEWMAENDLYGHTADGRQPADRVRSTKYEFCLVSENIAYVFEPRGFSPEKGAERFVRAWIDSPGHRRNMLDPDVTEFGVGAALGPRTNTFYAVQLFARPKSATIGFQVVNETKLPAPYVVGSREHTVKPGFTMTHRSCRPGRVKLVDATQGAEFEDGARFSIRLDGDRRRLVRLPDESEAEGE